MKAERGIGELVAVAGVMIGVLSMMSAFIRWVNEEVPTPYMDEEFHVRQTQHYCNGRWSEWDPKITTPPGLYYTSIALLRSVANVAGLSQAEAGLCTTPILRSLNSLHAAIFFLLSYFLLRQHGVSVTRALWGGFNCTLFPVLWFSSLLYYTDLLSVNLVLAMLLLNRLGLAVFAACLGAATLFVRQSNIVWVAFAAGLTAHHQLLAFLNAAKGGDGRSFKRGGDGPGLRATISETWRLLERRPLLWLDLGGRLFGRLGPFTAVAIGFVVFALGNGGLALGDKSAHSVVLHIPQLYYCLAFCAAFASPHILSPSALRDVWSELRWRPKLWLCLALSMAVAVAGLSYEHPYLLADNRHYSFYVWKNWFKRWWWCRYALIPGYVGSSLLLSRALKGESEVWRLGFALCLAGSVIPNRLLEFRYFILPYLLIRLHLPSPSSFALLLESLLFALINALTLALFFYRPFVWTHDPHHLQRFMW